MSPRAVRHAELQSNAISVSLIFSLASVHVITLLDGFFILFAVCTFILLDQGQQCPQTCHEHAQCKEEKGILGCYCASGYTGDGINFCEGKNALFFYQLPYETSHIETD